METELLVLIQMTFLNNVRKVGRLVLSRTSCISCMHLWFMLMLHLYTRNYLNWFGDKKKSE
jgi:hypothetical protein